MYCMLFRQCTRQMFLKRKKTKKIRRLSHGQMARGRNIKTRQTWRFGRPSCGKFENECFDYAIRTFGTIWRRLCESTDERDAETRSFRKKSHATATYTHTRTHTHAARARRSPADISVFQQNYGVATTTRRNVFHAVPRECGTRRLVRRLLLPPSNNKSRW